MKTVEVYRNFLQAEEEEKAKKEAAAEKRRHPVRRRFSKFFRWLCNFRS